MTNLENWRKVIKKLSDEDRFQKTWTPEGKKEYAFFKLITQENIYLSQYLKHEFPLKEGDLVLDVGGRQGDIAFSIQEPKYVHIVDPDPTFEIKVQPGKFLRCRIQDANLGETRYKMIIASHVWGYLGFQDVQKRIFEDLMENHLEKGGVFILFYNANSDYMKDLLEFAKENLTLGHFDYFDESLLGKYRNDLSFDIMVENASFDLDYDSWEELSKACWFLFGARDQDIEEISNLFLPKIKKDLDRPSFSIGERLTVIKRI